MRRMNRRSSHRGLRSLGTLLAKAAPEALKKRGFAQAQIVSAWREIVGDVIAGASCPERLSFPRDGAGGATLKVRVSGGLALELQHLEPVVVERINTHFGYRAVARLALVQGPLPPVRDRTPARTPARPLNAEEAESLSRQVSDVEDDRLRAVLRSLGERIRTAPVA